MFVKIGVRESYFIYIYIQHMFCSNGVKVKLVIWNKIYIYIYILF